MFTLIGIVVVLLATMTGYMLSGGKIAVLMQINEILILTGAGVGSMIAANGMKGFTDAIKGALGLMKPDPYTKAAYIELLKMMYQLFNVARKEGLLGLERHVENPQASDIIQKFPTFLAKHHACAFFCDTMKVILTGAVGPHDLSEMMELDLEVAHSQQKGPIEAMQTVGDAMPGFGIVAAVLGVIITMGKIDGEASAIGESVAAALVGTFLGILLAYGVFAPLARAMSMRLASEGQYMKCLQFALFSFARGESPTTCVEFARRNIEPSARPSFTETELAVKEKEAA